MSMKHSIDLVVGDWSRDGHGISEKYTVECNYNSKDVWGAIKAAKKWLELGEMCSDYEDSTIRQPDFDKLVEAGIDLTKYEYYDNEEEIHMCSDSWVMFNMWLAKTQLPDLEYKEVNNKSLEIGGYGLFWG